MAKIKLKTAKPKPDQAFQAMLDKQTPVVAKPIAKWLKKFGKKVSAALSAALFPANKVDMRRALGKALTPDQIDAIVNSIDLDDLQVLAGVITENSVGTFKAAYEQGAAVGGMVVDMAQVDANVVQYAQQRAAELVGKVMIDGVAYNNPNPAFSISTTTRNMIRADVAAALAGGASPDEFAKQIESGYAFSDTRAAAIARTELSNSYNQGSMAGWKASGVNVLKQSLLADDYDLSDECELAANDGAIPIDQAFSNGYMAPAYHPNCRCSLSPVVVDDGAKKVDLGWMIKNSRNSRVAVDLRLLLKDNRANFR